MFQKIKNNALLALVWVLTLVLLCLTMLPACTTPQRGQKRLQRACPSAEVLTYSFEDWTSTDERAYQTALRRCRDYYENSPCLKKFIRMEQHRYRAVCGNEAVWNSFDMWVE